MTSEREHGREHENLNPASAEDRIWAILERAAQQMEQDRERWRQRDERDRERWRQQDERDRERRRQQEEQQRQQDEQRRQQDEQRRQQDEQRQAQEREAREKADEKADREMTALRASLDETARRIRETDRQLKEAKNLFTSQWGRLVESLVEGDLVPLLTKRGITAAGTTERIVKKSSGETFEIDIVATNNTEAVVVEVKTTLRSEAVTQFLGKLSRFVEWCPEFQRHTIYGAVAYLQSDASVTAYAERQGLFIIRATGSSASIVNAADFKPRVFSTNGDGG